MTMRRITALGLCLMLTLGLMAGCSGGSASPTAETKATNTPGDNGGGDQASGDYSEHRTIKMATWFDQYYLSNHSDPYENPKVSDVDVAQMQIDNMRAIEEKYNITFLYENMTWEGVIESINTSIMAGQPDVDIYMADLQFGIPAVLSNYAQPISSFAAADSDIFTDQKVMQYVNFMDMPQSYLFGGASAAPEAYFLGFNLDMILAEGLEDPRDLYDRGEWTWDQFREYLKRLTKDTNSDNVPDVYGYSGVWTNLLSGLLLSNNAHIAGAVTQGLDSPNTLEVLSFINTLYNEDKTAKPWDAEGDFWEANNAIFAKGLTCFFVGHAWLLEEPLKSITFEVGAVPWPRGPQTTAESIRFHAVKGNWCFIPTGVQDPKRVYDVYFDWANWFNFDTDLRDDLGWWEDNLVSERNFELVQMMTQRTGFDIWDGIGVSLDFPGMLNGTFTPAQLAEENKLIYQDALDNYFNK